MSKWVRVLVLGLVMSGLAGMVLVVLLAVTHGPYCNVPFGPQCRLSHLTPKEGR